MKLKKKVKITIIVASVIAVLLITMSIIYIVLSAPVDKSSNRKVEVTIKQGMTTKQISELLDKKGLIKSSSFFLLYLKLNSCNSIKAGTYDLSKSMNIEKVKNTICEGKVKDTSVTVTFKEGKNMRWIASTIASNTNNKVEDVYALLNDKNYLNELINEYWFIDESILNTNIYYSLEGYLFPNTYEYMNKDVPVKEIFKSMLDEMNNKISPFKEDILNNKYTVHELLTLASIVELEGRANSDRAGIAGVFYNRLNNNDTLGSDVTTYYAIKGDMNERDLYLEEINDNNNYNTRSNYLAGKLPIGPISNPSLDSIKAVLYPTNSDYYYFVADKNGKTYFTYTYSEHLSKRDELIKAGLWYTYD